jgi:hypothetical protein
MLFRFVFSAASAAVLASLVGCSSSSNVPAYATCNDALPEAIHSEPTGGEPSQIELHAGTFYWITRLDPVTGESVSSKEIVALTPGGAPKLVASVPASIERFWIDADGLSILDANGAVWRATLDGASPPQKIATTDLNANDLVFAKDATTLYAIGSRLLTLPTPQTPTVTNMQSQVTIYAQPLDGTASRPFATWTVNSGGLGDSLFDDGDSLVGFGGGSLYRVAKSDGSVTTASMGDASIVYGGPLRNDVFLVGLGGHPRPGTLAIDGTATDLWPSDLPMFIAWAAGAASDGTAYFSGEARSAPDDFRPALARVRPNERAAIVLCTPETAQADVRVRVGDDAVYLVRGILNSSAWEIDRIPR